MEGRGRAPAGHVWRSDYGEWRGCGSELSRLGRLVHCRASVQYHGEFEMSDKPKQDGNDNTIGERIAKHLDGAAAVNLSEPSPGDLERVVDAYRVLRYAYEDAQERIEHLEMVVESKQEHLDTMTKERDEARGLR